jgi:ribosomal protein S1
LGGDAGPVDHILHHPAAAYQGQVTSVTDFGVFVEVDDGTKG